MHYHHHNPRSYTITALMYKHISSKHLQNKTRQSFPLSIFVFPPNKISQPLTHFISVTSTYLITPPGTAHVTHCSSHSPHNTGGEPSWPPTKHHTSPLDSTASTTSLSLSSYPSHLMLHSPSITLANQFLSQ